MPVRWDCQGSSIRVRGTVEGGECENTPWHFVGSEAVWKDQVGLETQPWVAE